MIEEIKEIELRVAAYNELTAEQGRTLYAMYVRRGLANKKLLSDNQELFDKNRALESQLNARQEEILKYRGALCSIEAGYGTIYHVPHDGSHCAEIAHEALEGSE